MVQSVERAFAILDAVAKRPAGVTALADRARPPEEHRRSPCSDRSRSSGAVERLDGKRWRVGPSVEALRANSSARAATRRRLRGRCSSSSSARSARTRASALPDGYDVLYVDQVECDHPVQVRDWTGTRAPMHAVPSGLVLMADWPQDAVDAYVARGLAALTPRTVVDPDQLRARLEEVRAAGYAWGLAGVRGGHRLGRGSDPGREETVAAIHVHGPRTASRRAAGGGVAREVVDAAAAIAVTSRATSAPLSVAQV